MEVIKVIEEFCKTESHYSFVPKFKVPLEGGRICVGIRCYENPYNIVFELCDYLRDHGFNNALGAVGGLVACDAEPFSAVIYFPRLIK